MRRQEKQKSKNRSLSVAPSANRSRWSGRRTKLACVINVSAKSVDIVGLMKGLIEMDRLEDILLVIIVIMVSFAVGRFLGGLISPIVFPPPIRETVNIWTMLT